MANLTLYRTYRFIDKDPVIDQIRTLIQDEGLMKKLSIVHELSGVATATLENWFNGDTKSPQNRTIMAVTSALGYKHVWQKDKVLDIDKELKAAKLWAEKQARLREETKRRTTRRPVKRHPAEQRVGAR
jgi:hypothetical protein